MTSHKKGDWRLSYIHSSIREGEAEPVTSIDALEDVDISTITYDTKEINEYFISMNVINCVNMNMHDYLEAVVISFDRFMKSKGLSTGELDNISIDFSRRFLNLLSMFRSFLDHTETSLARKFGKTSSEYLSWKDGTALAFDNNKSYRFMYKMRNYCQHLGMPPIDISYAANSFNDEVEFKMDFVIHSLLEYDSWGAIVRSDIESYSSNISVLSCIEEWAVSFRELSSLVLRIRRASALSSAERILSHRARLGLPLDRGEVCAVLFTNNAPVEKGMNISIKSLEEEKAKYIIDNPIPTEPL